MDQVVGQALTTYAKISGQKRAGRNGNGMTDGHAPLVKAVETKV
jgi:hypothetical protein